MQARDIMIAPPITIDVASSLVDAVQVMILNRLSALPVVDEKSALRGIISEGDLLHRSEIGTKGQSRSRLSDWFSTKSAAYTYRMANSRKVRDLMSTPAITIDDLETLDLAVTRMDEHKIKHLPVLSNGSLVGIISRFDLMRALQMFIAPAYEEQATSDKEIEGRIRHEMKIQPWARHCDVDVVVKNGRVILSGIVGNDDERLAFGIAAENVIGVNDVTNDIAVLEPMIVPFLS